MAEQKKPVKVILQVREIYYDIMNKTHLTGASRKAENPKAYETTAYMQASEDVESSYQLLRSINNAFAEVKVELGEYLTEDGSSTTNLIKKDIDDRKKVTLTFMLPSNFNNSACDSLGAGIHEYIVDKAVFDWFEITNKADAKDYHDLAEAALETAKRALYKRERPVRPTYTDEDLNEGNAGGTGGTGTGTGDGGNTGTGTGGNTGGDGGNTGGQTNP